MNKIFHLLLTIILCSVLNINLLAQGKNSVLSGQVIDKMTQEPLFGANIAIKGTSIGIASDLNGEFQITGVPSGKQTVMFRYLGFHDVDTLIDFSSGQVPELKIKLKPSAIMGQEVVISVQARGQMAAINQQRTSDVVSNIVSSDKMKEVPDVTAAESIGRLPGVSIQRSAGEGNKVVVRGLDPKYTNIKIDGVRMTGTGGDRSVGLTSIAPEMLDGIELSKSLTADKEADAFAGEINLRTRVAEAGFNINGNAMGTYSGLQNKFNGYRFALNAGNRFFDDKFGVLFSGGANQYMRINQSISKGYGADQLMDDNGEEYAQFYFSSANININETKRQRVNGNLTLDYKDDFMQIKFRNNMNFMQDEYINRNNTFAANTNNQFHYNINDGTPLEKSRIHALNTIFKIGSSQLFIDASYSKSENENVADKYYFIDNTAEKNDIKVTKSELYGASAEDIIADYYDISSIDKAYLKNNIRDSSINTDETYTAKLDWKVPYSLGEKLSGYIKVGGMHSTKNRKADVETIEAYYDGGIGVQRAERVYDRNPDYLRPSDIEGYTNNVGIPAINFEDVGYDYGEILKGDYTLGWSADMDELKRVHDYSQYSKMDEQYYKKGVSSNQSDYNTTETYNSAYIMAQIKIGEDLSLIPGIRYEKMQTRYASNWVETDEFAPSGMAIGYPVPVELKNRENMNWFPSINVKYDIFKWMDIRTSYYKSVSRPNFSSLSPGVVYGGTAIRMQNPYLRPAFADNYDLGVSFFTHKLGLLTVNGFYKEVTDLLGTISGFKPLDYEIMVGAPKSLTDQLNQHINDETLLSPDFLYKNGKAIPVEVKNGYPFNNPEESWVKGLEISWQSNFWYLPGLWRGLVLDLNVTLINSEATYPYIKMVREKVPHPSGLPIPYYETTPHYETTTRQRDNQPGTIYNARIGWDYRGFSTRLSMRYESENVTGTNQISQYKDYRDDLFRMDLNLQQKITEHLTATIDLSNLTSSYENVNTRVVSPNEARGDKEWSGDELSKQYYGMQAQVGLRFNF